MNANKLFWSGAIFQLFQFLIVGIMAMVYFINEINWNFLIVTGIIWTLLNIVSLVFLIVGAFNLEE